MIIIVFILFLIVTVLADKKQNNASIETEDYSQYDKSSKKYSKEFSKKIIDKINKNHLLMSHILLKQSLTGNYTKPDFSENNLSRKGKEDLLQNTIISKSQKDHLKFDDNSASNNNDEHKNSKLNEDIYQGGRRNLDNENENEAKHNEKDFKEYENENQSQPLIPNLNRNTNPVQKPMILPIIIPRPYALPVPHPLAINYSFGSNMMFPRPLLSFMQPPRIFWIF